MLESAAMGFLFESTQLTEDLNLQLATGHRELQGWSPGCPRPLYFIAGLSQTACHPFILFPIVSLHLSYVRV